MGGKEVVLYNIWELVSLKHVLMNTEFQMQNFSNHDPVTQNVWCMGKAFPTGNRHGEFYCNFN